MRRNGRESKLCTGARAIPALVAFLTFLACEAPAPEIARSDHALSCGSGQALCDCGACLPELACFPNTPAGAQQCVDFCSTCTPVFSVTAFGAVCDGVNPDDTQGIQAAIDAANAAGGGAILFPVGTCTVKIQPPTNTALTLPGPNLQLMGAGPKKSAIRLADNQGDYRALLSSYTVSQGFYTDSSNLTITGITVDVNSHNNPITVASTPACIQFDTVQCPLYNGSGGRWTLEVNQGSNIAIAGNAFKNVDNVNTVYINGVHDHVTVANNSFTNVGADSTAPHDHSTIYVTGSNLTISGNVFVGGGSSATTAIETHGSAQKVFGNATALFQKGLNITGVWSQTSQGVHVFHNTVLDANVGMELWSEALPSAPGQGPSSPVGLSNAIVEGNLIGLNRDYWRAAIPTPVAVSGIQFQPDAYSAFASIQVNSNYIQCTSCSAASLDPVDVDSWGIAAFRLPTVCAPPCTVTANVCVDANGGACAAPFGGVDQNIAITGNWIIASPSTGIYVNFNDGALFNLTVDGNAIFTPGTDWASSPFPGTTTGYNAGIELWGKLTGAADCSNNFLVGDPGVLLWGIYAVGADLSAATTATAKGNAISPTGIPLLAQPSPPFLTQ
jgi:hypothetical protein